jgi:bifunctional lysine-specific demethylase and histidyl-hydroxylase NO66
VTVQSRRAVLRDRPALDRVVSVGAAEFARDYWDERPLLSSAVSPDGFVDLFSERAVDELVSRRGLRTPFLRVAKDGQVLPGGQFTGPGGIGASIADQVDEDKVLELFLDGSTLVLQGLHRVWPPLVEFTSQLSTDMGHPCQVNAYVTPPQSQGFSAHYDTHDVFVLEVAGEKRWQIWDSVLDRPRAGQPWTEYRTEVEKRAGEEPLIDTVLRPGDALYLPRGFLHAARALGGTTVHLTIGIHPFTRVDVIDELLQAVGEVSELRRALPIGHDEHGARGIGHDVDATVREVVRMLADCDPEAVADALLRRLAKDNRPAPLSPLIQAEAMGNLTADSVVIKRPQLRVLRRERPEGIVLELRTRTLDISASHSEALDFLLDGEPHVVSDVPGLSTDAALDLVRRLLRAGVLIPTAR